MNKNVTRCMKRNVMMFNLLMVTMVVMEPLQLLHVGRFQGKNAGMYQGNSARMYPGKSQGSNARMYQDKNVPLSLRRSATVFHQKNVKMSK